MVLLITNKISFTLLTIAGVFSNIHLVRSKPVHHGHQKDCFELCGHKLFEISEKVYDSGNISMKCSPYYTFGECVEKCYNHHDTTVSLQFLKKCDEAVHHAYSGVSKHKKCLQQNFGKAREHCSLKCAKKALEETIDEDTASRNSSSDEWEQSSGSLCLNQVCRLDCLYDLLIEKCPGASEGVMNALLAPFDVFGKMMKKFSSHHSFEKSVNSSSCKDLFGGIIIENRLDNSLNTTNEVDALDKTMSDFVSSFKPTPPAPLEVVSKPHSTRLVKKQISDYPIYDMDYSGHSKGGNIYEDYLNGGGNSIYDYYDGGESQDQSENGNNQNVLYQVNHNFNGPAHTHTLDVQPSNYRFTGPASDECGDIMILDDNEQIPLCSTPTIYFITSPQNTIKTILLNYGVLERYSSKDVLTEEIYAQYKHLMDRMKAGTSQGSSMFESDIGGVDEGFFGSSNKLNHLGNLRHFKGVDSTGSLHEEFIKNAIENDIGSINDKLEDTDDNEVPEDRNESKEEFVEVSSSKPKNHDHMHSGAGKKSATSTQPFNEEDFEDDFSHHSLFHSFVPTPESKATLKESNSHFDTKHPVVGGKMMGKEKKVSTFHGQDVDFKDRFNNVLPDHESISYGVDGLLVPRSPATRNLMLPIIRGIVGRRTDDH